MQQRIQLATGAGGAGVAAALCACSAIGAYPAAQHLRDALMACSACGGTIFFDATDPERACVRCGERPADPLFLTIGVIAFLGVTPTRKKPSAKQSLGIDVGENSFLLAPHKITYMLR